MNEKELVFCENYESKVREFEILTILKDELTDKGLKVYNSIHNYLKANVDRYLELMNP